MRLIDTVHAQLQLLDAIKAVPADEKLAIPRLRDALLNQGDVLRGIQSLIAAGELDQATLRPPSCSPVQFLDAQREAELIPVETSSSAASTRPTGEELADALVAYAAEHGLAEMRLSKHLFGGTNAIGRLRKAKPRPETIAKIEALLAGPPPHGLERRRAGGPRKAEVGKETGAGLAAELDALIAREGLSKTAVGLHLANNRSWVEVLRKSNPRRATVDKVRAFLADPPIEKLRIISPPAVPLAETPARLSPGPAARELCGPSVEAANLADAPPEELDARFISGAELAARLIAEGERRGLQKSAISRAIFGNATQLTNMARSERTVFRKTADKAEAWLAGLGGPSAPAVSSPAPRRQAEPQPFERQVPPSAAGNALKSLAVRRGNTKQAERLIEREAAGETVNRVSPMVRAAANDIRSRREAEARQADPVEAAKLVLQRKGHRVFSAVVSEGPKGDGYFYVGQQRVDQARLLEMAAKASESDPLPTYLKPAEMAWCDQCEQRCSGARAARCTTPFCKLKTSDVAKVGFGGQRRQA